MNVDWVAVERAIKGQPVGRRLNSAEVADVARKMHERGHADTAIGRRLNRNAERVRELIEGAP